LFKEIIWEVYIIFRLFYFKDQDHYFPVWVWSRTCRYVPSFKSWRINLIVCSGYNDKNGYVTIFVRYPQHLLYFSSKRFVFYENHPLMTHRRHYQENKGLGHSRNNQPLQHVLSVDVKIILEWILGKQGGKFWTCCIWLRIRASGGLLWTR